MTMRVLVTGHRGYIGSVLTRELVAAGHSLSGLDAGYFDDCTLGPPDGLMAGGMSSRKDIRDVTRFELTGLDAVIHLAALCNDPIGDLNPELTYDINHRATVRLARLAKEAGVPRFIFSSSCSVYGDAGVDDELRETAATRPLTPYAVSKARAEEDIAAIADDSFSPVFLRNGSVYGLSPRLRADIVLNNLVCWAVTTGRVTMLTDGSPWRPLVHVEDVAAVISLVLTAPREIIHNQVFNVGVPGENYRVRDLAEIVCDAVPGSEIVLVPHAGGDTRDYRVSFDEAHDHISHVHAALDRAGWCTAGARRRRRRPV